MTPVEILQTIESGAEREAFAEAVPVVGDDLIDRGPIAVAWHLSQQAGLNDDQKRPSICAADAMETAWQEECLQCASKRAAGTMQTEPKWLTP